MRKWYAQNHATTAAVAIPAFFRPLFVVLFFSTLGGCVCAEEEEQEEEMHSVSGSQGFFVGHLWCFALVSIVSCFGSCVFFLSFVLSPALGPSVLSFFTNFNCYGYNLSLFLLRLLGFLMFLTQNVDLFYVNV
jgi:hypothetical protein